MNKDLKIPLFGIFVAIGIFAFVVFGTNIPQVMEKQNQIQQAEPKPPKALTLEDCERVSGSSPPEVQSKCMQLWKITSGNKGLTQGSP